MTTGSCPARVMMTSDQLKAFALGPPIPLDEGAILERNRAYLIPLQESLDLPGGIHGRANVPRA